MRTTQFFGKYADGVSCQNALHLYYTSHLYILKRLQLKIRIQNAYKFIWKNPDNIFITASPFLHDILLD